METLVLDISRVTEAAALASYGFVGKGNKVAADDKAVKAMKLVLNALPIDAEVVIGEGEIDEAPMLYIGEKLGNGGTPLDIAVDPIDGTRMVALGQDNAVAVIAFAKRGSLLNAPDMYMQKIMVNSLGKGSIDLELPIEENIKNLAQKLKKDITELKIMTLAKPRHNEDIKRIQAMGAKVIAIPDGDVEGSILVAMPDFDIDMFYGIGGAPEGVISAAIIRSLGGDMKAKLLTRVEAKGYMPENEEISQDEIKRCQKLGINLKQIFNLEDLVKSDDLLVSMTGITPGKLLSGVRMSGNVAKTETLILSGSSKSIRKIKTTHLIDKKDEKLKKLIEEK